MRWHGSSWSETLKGVDGLDYSILRAHRLQCLSDRFGQRIWINRNSRIDHKARAGRGDSTADRKRRSGQTAHQISDSVLTISHSDYLQMSHFRQLIVKRQIDAIEELEETARLYLLLHGKPTHYLSAAQVADLKRRFP